MKPVIPESVLSQHIAVLGKTGSGKTSTAKLLVEQVVASGARVCILDPVKSDWWGLTSSADGKRAGLPFHILGGRHGHVSLHPQAGNAIGEIVASGQLPLSILDMSDFEMGGLQQFFVHFAPALLRKMRGVLYLVIEEAHEFAPKERAGFGQENMAIHFAKKLATAGRSKGIRMVIATQRTQALHNAVLGSCETMIAHRLISPADQEPVAKWLRANLTKEKAKEVEASLSTLKTGEAWVCSGESGLFERRQFPRISTYDNSATPSEDSGDVTVKTAEVDRDHLRSIIGSAVEEAKANDPAELKRKIAELEKRLRLAAAPTSTTEIREVKVPDRDSLAALIDKMDSAVEACGHVEQALENTSSETVRLRGEVELLSREIKHQLSLSTSQRAFIAKSTPEIERALARQSVGRVQRVEINSSSEGSSEVGRGGLRRILIAIAQRPGLDNRQLGLRACLSSRSGTFSTYLAKARTNGWITQNGSGFHLTEEGAKALGSFEDLPTGSELREYWINELGRDSGASRMLTALCEAYPHSMTNDQLGEAANISSRSGTFSTYLSKLRGLELVEGRGDLRASQELFE